MPPDVHDLSQLTDAELVSRTSAGDREAFGVLFGRHHRSVYRFSLQMTGAADVAEDLTQDVFMALARGSARYSPSHGALSTYLYGIARHLVLQRDRKRRSRAEINLDALGDGETPVTWEDPVDQLARTQRTAALRQAILRLPTHYREVLVLCELHGVSYDDAAAIVGCPIGTIRSRLNRARRLVIERCRGSLASSAADTARPVSWLYNRRPRIVGPQS